MSKNAHQVDPTVSFSFSTAMVAMVDVMVVMVVMVEERIESVRNAAGVGPCHSNDSELL